MADMAKVPHPYDMDPGQFIQHWCKRHVIVGVFDETHVRFPDDTTPLWSAIKRLHDRIHNGDSEFPIPDDHVHLPSLTKELEALL